MTEEEIIKLAIEHTVSSLKFDEDGILRFAKLIAEHEREACAKIVESHGSTLANGLMLTEAIRARGQA